MKKIFSGFYTTALILGLLYIFLVSIALMSHSFGCFGKGFSERLIATTSNPVVALFIGVLVTSIIQSSSTTTSMVVGFVAGGVLSIRCAIPIVMGANIGTTITNTLVALTHVTRKEEFKRAFTSSTIHDLFNLMTVIVLFPLEMATRFLEKSATFLASFLEHSTGFQVTSPFKALVNPAVDMIDKFFTSFLNLPLKTAGILTLILSFILLIFSLVTMAKFMKRLVASKAEIIFDKILAKNALTAMLMGCLFTAIVRSSSITTSILVPLVASGILRIETAYPIVLGANVGTTVTAIIASLTGNIAAITIALVHFLFNICGILIFYPIKAVRRIPIILAGSLAALVSEKKIFAFIYVLGVFFVIPIILIWISNIIRR